MRISEEMEESHSEKFPRTLTIKTHSEGESESSLKNLEENENTMSVLETDSESNSSEIVSENRSMTMTMEQPELEPNLNCEHANSFEVHFRKPEVQRAYKLKLLMFEMWMKICFLLVTSACSLIAFHKFYRQNKSTTRIILLIITAVFWLLMVVLPYVISLIKKLNQYPWIIVKIITDAVLKLCQIAIFSFWTDLIFVEIWIRIGDHPENVPFLYTIPAYCALILIIHLVIVVCTILAESNPTKCQLFMVTQALIALFLVISIDIITFTKLEPLFWHLYQICLAALLAEINYLMERCTSAWHRNDKKQHSNRTEFQDYGSQNI